MATEDWGKKKKKTLKPEHWQDGLLLSAKPDSLAQSLVPAQ